MDMFEQYEREFTHRSNTIRDRITNLGELNGEKKKAAIYETERQIDDARKIITHMESSKKNATTERQRRMDTKIRGYQAELNKMARDLQSMSLVGSSQNNRGFGGGGRYNDEYGAADHRTQVLAGNRQLDESNERLLNAHRIANETENIGVDVLSELGVQRQALERARDNLGRIDDNVSKSRRILNAMTRRIATNKLILALIIILLLAANVLIIFFKWIKPLIH
eukprot:TRINITY_DN21084_c0_g1_i1.p1 TRINITY_DN21084_c0_g1~~TRINITY_DN21084_c0_g1_i1.p1  ORF type:complete len:243 (-),score=45.17 TRINITY_DN21084_c0_g1_i1:37-708(-)